MSPSKPVGEKPPDPNEGGGNTGAHDLSPAPNQDVRGPGGPPGDNGAPAAGLENPRFSVSSSFFILVNPEPTKG